MENKSDLRKEYDTKVNPLSTGAKVWNVVVYISLAIGLIGMVLNFISEFLGDARFIVGIIGLSMWIYGAIIICIHAPLQVKRDKKFDEWLKTKKP